MLRTYLKLEDVPEALREHYKLIDGKYVAELGDDHPVLTNNAKLLSEKNTAEATLANVKTELQTAKDETVQARAASGVPRGHRAIPVADVELLEKVKAFGTADEIAAKLAEHQTLKEEADGRKREDHLREVATVLEFNADAFIHLPNLPEFDIRDADGKKTVIAKVKDAAGTITEKPAAEFIEASKDIAPFLPALKTRPGTYAPEQRRDNPAPPKDQFERIRASVKEAEKLAMPPSAVETRFGIQKTA